MRAMRQGCPECDSVGIPIVYGLPGPKLVDVSMQGAVVLGGCFVSDESPRWQCDNDHTWKDAPDGTA